MGGLSQFLFWVTSNWQQIIAVWLGLVAAASVLIKSLEKGVALLVTIFPSLKNADGELQSIAAWLDALAKWAPLNSLALTPKHALPAPLPPVEPIKAAIIALALAGALWGAPARAAVTYQTGPTIPFVMYDVGSSGSPVQVLGGAGWQVSFSDSSLQKTLAGKSWDMLDLMAMAFGSRVTGQSGQTFGELSGGLGLCTMSSLVCLVGGKRIVDSVGGFTGSKGWFVGAAMSLNFGLSYIPQNGVAEDERRGNTLYF
jgi:hypothetical protein